MCVCVNASGRHPAYVRQAQFFFFFTQSVNHSRREAAVTLKQQTVNHIQALPV